MLRILKLILCLILFPGLLYARARLPENINWQTNLTAPVYASPDAKKGGTYRSWLLGYPLTFRLYGPNSNSGGFVNYNRSYALWSLTDTHPNTLETIPMLATHWAIMPDNKTVYYKLDPDARWSDRKKITADDYIFAYKFLQSRFIRAPFYNQYIRNHFEVVEKIDQYTIKIVGKKSSWRILNELDLSPLPKHAVKLNKNWVKKYQWKPNVVPGPYVLKKFRKGKYIEFHRIKNWWGENKRWFKNRFNFDKIRLNVVRSPEVAFELFKKNKFDVFSLNETQWVRQSNFREVKKGYLNKQMIFIEAPSGAMGIFFNTKSKILKDKLVRRALAKLFDFKTINQKFLYGLQIRKHLFFDALSPYNNHNFKTWEYDVASANSLLDKAGWDSKRDQRGTRVKNGNPLEIEIIIGTSTWNKYLSFYKESAKKAGINIKIKVLDSAAFFKAISENRFTAAVLAYGGGRFPSPRQFLHTENIAKNTNNLFLFGNKEIDKLIKVYEFSLNEQERIKAINRIEEIIKENSIWLPFWKSDHLRFLWWRYIKGPKSFVTKTGFDKDSLWIDKTLKKKLKKKKSYPLLPLKFDPYNLK